MHVIFMLSSDLRAVSAGGCAWETVALWWIIAGYFTAEVGWHTV